MEWYYILNVLRFWWCSRNILSFVPFYASLSNQSDLQIQPTQIYTETNLQFIVSCLSLAKLNSVACDIYLPCSKMFASIFSFLPAYLTVLFFFFLTSPTSQSWSANPPCPHQTPRHGPTRHLPSHCHLHHRLPPRRLYIAFRHLSIGCITKHHRVVHLVIGTFRNISVCRLDEPHRVVHLAVSTIYIFDQQKRLHLCCLEAEGPKGWVGRRGGWAEVVSSYPGRRVTFPASLDVAPWWRLPIPDGNLANGSAVQCTRPRDALVCRHQSADPSQPRPAMAWCWYRQRSGRDLTSIFLWLQ